MAGWVAEEQAAMLELLRAINAKVDSIQDQMVASSGKHPNFWEELEKIEADVRLILKYLTPKQAVRFEARMFSGEDLDFTNFSTLTTQQRSNIMAKATAKASGDLRIADDGSVILTVNALDSDSIPTTWPEGAALPTAAEVDPTGAPGPSFNVPAGVTTSTPTGFTIQVRVLQPPPQPLVAGIGFNISVASGFPNQTGPITVPVAGLADIVPGAAGTFVATEAAGS